MPRLASNGAGDPRISIAVLDGPVDLDHPCFSGAILELPLGQPAFDAHDAAARHGTHVASVIFGQPGGAVEGIAPRCRGLIIPIFADRGDGKGLACSQLDLARAILAALEHGAHFINISGGQMSPSGAPEPMLAQAIERCARRNVLIIAAAGNDGCDCLHVPAAAPSVLAVGAMDAAGRPLGSSNYGGAYRTQGILAPGAEIRGAVPGCGTALKSGTSYATPFVTGQAALLASLQTAGGGLPDPAAIRAALLDSAAPCPDEANSDCRRFLAGRIDVNAAINLIQGEIVMTEGFATQHPGADFRVAPAPELQPQDAAQPAPTAWASPASASSGAAVVRPSGDAIPAAPPPGVLPADGPVAPSDCGCGCGGKGKDKADGDCGCGCGGAKAGGAAPKKPQLVYAMGTLGYDFGSEARRDSIAQSMSGGNPLSAADFLAHLETNPWDAASVIWTLNLDATPIYAVHPAGAFAEAGYKILRDALAAQLNEGADIVSIPGVIAGTAALESGQVVPLIMPALRGIHFWATAPLVTHVLGVRPDAAAAQAGYDRLTAGLTNFLGRVYYDLRNLGIAGEERALNYAATNAIQIAAVIQQTTSEELELDTISVKRSPVCRPDSECYDVELAFFNPANTNVADRIHRFTVDVSDVVPVTLGVVRSWARRA